MPRQRDRIGIYRAIQRRYRPDVRQFEQLVMEAFESLPPELRRRVENVAILVEEEPAEHHDTTLLGVYQGIALPRRGTDYHLAAPDRITLFRRPILATATSREAVIQEIRNTLVHEIGHYFGLDEHELP